MKKTRILAFLLAVLTIAGCLAACGESGGTTPTGDQKTTDASGATGASGTATDAWTAEEIAQMGEEIKKEANGKDVTLKVWAPELAQDEFKAEVKEFCEIFKDYATIKCDVSVQGEGDAAAQVITDPKAAADVFGFASDQLSKLTKGNSKAVAECFFSENVTAMNTPNSVAAATVDGKIYAYPETGDNSYFLVYDNRLVSDEQAKTFEGVFEACNAAKKKFIMNSGDGYFTCMYLFTGGLVTEGLDTDGITQKFNDYDINKLVDSVSAFANLFKTNTKYFESADTTAIADGFKNNTTAAGIAGSWNVATIKKALTDENGVCHAGFAILPTINIKGTATQIINMFGYKFIGVNSQSKSPFAAQVLAYYLTNEENQLARAKALEWGPSNTNAQNDEFVKNNQSMNSILEQSKYSVPQTGLATTFWDPCKALGTYMIEFKNDFSDAALKKQIEQCIVNIIDE